VGAYTLCVAVSACGQRQTQTKCNKQAVSLAQLSKHVTKTG
jgi:hypothetical protein